MINSSEHSPTMFLLLEHNTISQVQELVASMEGLWVTDANEYSQCVFDLITFFVEYSDKFHHSKEEEVLFPLMSNHAEFILYDMLDELKEHHELFRTYTEKINQALVENEFSLSYKLLKEYLNNLLDHIAMENDELFSIADTLFSDSELEKMYFLFIDMDKNLGIELKQKLSLIPSQLSERIKTLASKKTTI